MPEMPVLPIEPTVADKVAAANDLVKAAFKLLPWADPVACVQWIASDMVVANDYNPNAVAHQEMKLLHTSVWEDGYTQPIVAIWDPTVEKYVIVDGFHRWTVMRKFEDIKERTQGYLPVVVLDKDPADRMASTIRHNRARGKHSVAGMSSIVFQMLNEGEDDASICNKLGLEAEELARLKHITGYSKLFANRKYSALILSKTQTEAKGDYQRLHPTETVPEF